MWGVILPLYLNIHTYRCLQLIRAENWEFTKIIIPYLSLKHHLNWSRARNLLLVCRAINGCKSNLAGNATISAISSSFKRGQNPGMLLFTVSLNQIFQIHKCTSWTHIHRPKEKWKSENKDRLTEVDWKKSVLTSFTSRWAWMQNIA